MNGFNAVVTTGIYCRPGCAGRPNPANVRHFDLAAAAEAAGFRACLRCRPYRDPEAAPAAASELVCRAIRLVVGDHEGSDERAIAARLGLSSRHLRRLFRDQVGVTPSQLARSSRAHFARRLLDDTDLLVTDIAYASGFGSLRQFNRTLREIFSAAPSELRARRRNADRLVADGGLPLRLGFAGALAWEPALAFLAARAIGGVEHVCDGVYRRTIVVEGDPGVIEVRRGGSDHLVLTAHLPHWNGLLHVVERARRLFNLDVDADAADIALRTDPLIGPLIDELPGLRPVGAWDPFEVGVRAIIGQQVTVAGASTLAARLVERAGTPVPGLGRLGLTHAFPTPEVLAEADLGGVGLTPARVEAIRAFSAAVADGSLRLDRSRPLDEVVPSLLAVPGIGPWTAQYLALRLGEPDAFPSGYLGLRRSIDRLAGSPLEPRAISEVERGWKPWRAHAAFHLWSLQR